MHLPKGFKSILHYEEDIRRHDILEKQNRRNAADYSEEHTDDHIGEVVHSEVHPREADQHRDEQDRDTHIKRTSAEDDDHRDRKG